MLMKRRGWISEMTQGWSRSSEDGNGKGGNARAAGKRPLWERGERGEGW
jgi:hypothetical protein